DGAWHALLVIVLVCLIDVGRTVAPARAARRYSSAALSSNALHFGSDLAGSTAVLIGLLFVRAGYAQADSIAALFVACIVLLVAVRLMRRNVDVLMDVAPADAEEAARLAITRIQPAVALRRPRMPPAACRSVDSRTELSLHLKLPGDLSLEEAHEIAEEVERAIREAVPEVDAVLTHLEPLAEESEGTRPRRTEVAEDFDLVERIVRDATDTE